MVEVVELMWHPVISVLGFHMKINGSCVFPKWTFSETPLKFCRNFCIRHSVPNIFLAVEYQSLSAFDAFKAICLNGSVGAGYLLTESF